MRLGAFLFGGLLGAAAVIYLNNKNRSMILEMMSSNNQSLGGMMNKAQNNIADTMGNNNQTMTAGSSAAATDNIATTGKKNQKGASLERVEDIVRENPELKVTVGEILAKNNQKKEVQEILQPH
ncbi:hypothetical protein [Paenibacillus xerothermodurans]|uniref:Uncharacterized protein n=1 Tax=Paenibacillus xerothermodurans TaxID=1977292 RepID=A0A2W1NTG0_PAEXE|nr:hypothetical protein [Paenibacillus xerothermodurans]PZE21973.1 hypothetical protein CBW46_006125 [Paenibacillus xerothermodurans]